MYSTCKSPLNVLIFVFPQFFDRDGDGVVSGADLSGHLPFRSLSHLHGNNSRQTQGCDHEETLPNEMNMGEQSHNIMLVHNSPLHLNPFKHMRPLMLLDSVHVLWFFLCLPVA